MPPTASRTVSFEPRLAKLSAGSSAPTPARSRRKDARPGELLAAATELFIEKGFAATRVDEVAARAGVSKGTLFLYFPSKEELLKSVVREHLGSRFAQWSVEIDDYLDDSASLLRYALHQWWTHEGATAVSSLCKLMTAEARNFPELAEFYAREVQGPGSTLLHRIIQRGVDRGEFQSIDVEYVVCCLKAQMQFLELWLHSGQPVDPGAHVFEPERFIDVLLELILHGLCRPTNATPRRAAP
jgi:TetR/AcrR family transcriptional regulator